MSVESESVRVLMVWRRGEIQIENSNVSDGPQKRRSGARGLLASAGRGAGVPMTLTCQTTPTVL